jgi:hypothetical protein
MHLLCHSTLTRGQVVQNMELPDIHFAELPAEGSMPCTVLIIISNHGRTNQFGKIEFYSCMCSMSLCVQFQLWHYTFSLGGMWIRSHGQIYHQMNGMILKFFVPKQQIQESLVLLITSSSQNASKH